MATDTADTHEIMTSRELAEFLRVSPDLLRQWRTRTVSDDSGPPAFRAGGRVRYRRSSVMQWIEERERADAAWFAGLESA